MKKQCVIPSMMKLALTLSFFAASAAQAQTMNPLEQGVAITDPLVIRALEAGGWGFGAALGGSTKPGDFISNSDLRKLKVLDPVLSSLKVEFEDYMKTHPDTGVGLKFGKRVFDYNHLSSPMARFVLVGVVNRMDRGYVETKTCGEIRLIYRLAYAAVSNGEKVSSRLPMTFNLILAARPEGSNESCADVARPWIALKNSASHGKPSEIAAQLVARDGALSFEKRSLSRVLRLETNLQIVRWPAVVRPDFGGHAEYLLKVYRWNAKANVFEESLLENQIDRDRVLSNPALLARLKAWLVRKETLKLLDDGTLIIPDEFLAKRAFSTAPGGLARSANHPFKGVFSDQELEKILADARDIDFKHIKSPKGFQRRLTEITCSGCHQTRTIAGFHFMGRDPWGRYPGNSVFVPASPHFYADLARRQQIVEAYMNGQEPDFRRSFAARPDAEFDSSLKAAAPGLVDGWGAHCSSSQDPSFKSWTCAAGLSCRYIHRSADEPGIGVCLPSRGQQVGDPKENGVVVSQAFGKDKYQLENKFEIEDPNRYIFQPQSATPGNKTGGFPGSMIHLKSCDNLPKEAACGPLPGSKSGFNACLSKGINFLNCLRDYSTNFGLRGCSISEPCRDDYICAEGLSPERGVCVPPYFLFQFRVDGHPLSKK